MTRPLPTCRCGHVTAIHVGGTGRCVAASGCTCAAVNTPAVPAGLPPVAARVAGQIQRAAATLDDSRWAETAAMVVVSTGEIRDGLAALPVLDELRARHTPVSWGPGSSVRVCPVCRVGAPCDEAVLLGAAR